MLYQFIFRIGVFGFGNRQEYAGCAGWQIHSISTLLNYRHV